MGYMVHNGKRLILNFIDYGTKCIYFLQGD